MTFKEKLTKFFFDEGDEYDYEESSAAISNESSSSYSNDGYTSKKNQIHNNKHSNSNLSVISRKDNSSQKARIKIMEPRLYSEVRDIADILLSNESVVLNFRRMDKEQAKKVIDFLMGITYAIRGDIQRIGDQIFLCTPDSIEIDGNELHAIKNGDLS